MQTYIHSDLRSYVGELFGTAIVRFLHYCTNNCLVLGYNKYTVRQWDQVMQEEQSISLISVSF